MAPQVVQYPRATSLTAHSSHATGVEGAGGRKRAWLRCPWAVAGPGWASRRRITTQHRRRRRCGGRRRARRARAGFEIDHSEPLGSRVAISRAAGTDGARNTSGATSNKLNHAFQPHHWCGGRRRVRRAQEGLAAVPEGGGGAWLGFETAHHHPAPQAPPVWRAPEGPESARGPGCGARGRRRGLAGQRADAPSLASATRRRRCGGRRRVRRARAGFEIDHSERSSRVAISRAAGPDGARNTSGATSTTERRSLRTPRSTPGSGRPGGRRGTRAR